MIKFLIRLVLLYIAATVVTTVAMHDFSLRHTLFLLADALVLLLGAKLVREDRTYYKGLAITLGVLCSVFMIRYLTPTALKVWDVDIYISFCLAVANMVIMLAAIIPNHFLKKPVVFIAGTLVFIPVIICWGYYATELSWLNVNGMMAVLQTNVSEAVEYVKDRTGMAAVLLLAFYILLMAVWVTRVCKIEVKRYTRPIVVGLAFFFILNGILMVRTSDNFVTSIYRETRDYQKNYDDYAYQKERRKQNLANVLMERDSGRPGVYVLVIGESQNPGRMSAYGYSLPTTPWLDSMKKDPNLLLFQHAYSCQVQTVPALTYALTAKNQYNSLELNNAVSLIDIAKAAGYDTVWLSNQVRYGGWGTPITVIADEADRKIWINSHQGDTLDTEYYDGELVNRLQEIKPSEKMLIVIHLMGNHISYHNRYPSEFEKFKGQGKRSEYDNSILYNDHVMKRLYETLRTWKNFKGLLYFSDHGEDITTGKSHNPDTFVFEMAYIPMYMYFTPAYRQENEQIFETLWASRARCFTNDLIFNTMLGIMNIRNDAFYEAENDLTFTGYNGDLNRFKTLYGKRNISEDVRKP